LGFRTAGKEIPRNNSVAKEHRPLPIDITIKKFARLSMGRAEIFQCEGTRSMSKQLDRFLAKKPASHSLLDSSVGEHVVLYLGLKRPPCTARIAGNNAPITIRRQRFGHPSRLPAPSIQKLPVFQLHQALLRAADAVLAKLQAISRHIYMVVVHSYSEVAMVLAEVKAGPKNSGLDAST
jgi:hypothetical protein